MDGEVSHGSVSATTAPVEVDADVDVHAASGHTAIVGERLGRYIVLAYVASGGMGHVYRAYDERLKREVAIKLLKSDAPGQWSGQVGQRLVREAQAMAQLSHPHVLPVYDVEEQEDRLFLVMEFVDGQTVAAWAGAKQRSEAEILRVFVEAGRGLAAAHERGLVHRDVKPSNMMLGADKRTRVMDFGLTCRTETVDRVTADGDAYTSGEGVSLAYSEDGLVMGTPAYMAPEQHRGELVTPKSDQYAFCVSLYRTLYGEHPFGSKTVYELGVVKELGPPSWPAEPRLAVSESVKAVVRRGLQPDPGDRFGSMNELLQQLRPKRGRWRWGGLASVAVFATGIGGAVGLSQAGDACDDAAAQLSGTWGGPRRAKLRARLSDVAGDALEGSTTEALDRWSEVWIQQYADACHLDVAGVAEAQGRLACLERQRQQARAITSRLLSSSEFRVVGSAPVAVESLADPASCVVAEGSSDAADSDEAVRLDGILAEIHAAAVLGAEPTLVARANAALERATQLGEPAVLMRAHRAFAAALKGRREDEALAVALKNAFLLAIEQRDPRSSAELAVELAGIVGSSLGRAEAGLLWAEHADAWLTDEQPSLRARLELERAAIWNTVGRYEEAAAGARRTRADLERSLGPQHTDVARSMGIEAIALMRLGRLDESRQRHADALELLKALFGPTHPSIALAYQNLSATETLAGDLDAGEAALVEARDIFSELNPTHPQLNIVYSNLGAIAGRREDHALALSYFEQSLKIVEHNGSETAALVRLLPNMASAQIVAGQHAKALASAERGLEVILETTGGGPHVMLAQLALYRAESLGALGRHPEAAAAWRQSLRHAEEAGDSRSTMALLRGGLARSLMTLGDREEAEANFRLSLELWERGYRDEDREQALAVRRDLAELESLPRSQ